MVIISDIVTEEPLLLSQRQILKYFKVRTWWTLKNEFYFYQLEPLFQNKIQSLKFRDKKLQTWFIQQKNSDKKEFQIPSSLFVFFGGFGFWGLEVFRDEIRRKKSFAAMVAALPPVGVAVVGYYHWRKSK